MENKDHSRWTSRLLLVLVLVIVMMYSLVVLDKISAEFFVKFLTGDFFIFMTGRAADKLAGAIANK